MQNKKTYHYTLDFSDRSTLYDAYRAIDKQFDLPIQCSENLNAFWDVLHEAENEGSWKITVIETD